MIASLPSIKFLPASGRIPDIDDFVLAFQSNASLLELRPYFEGYCGEHISQYRGMQQKAGVFGHSGIFLPTRWRSDINATNHRQCPPSSALHNGPGEFNVGDVC